MVDLPTPVSVVPPIPQPKRPVPRFVRWLLGLVVLVLIVGVAFYFVYLKDSFGLRARMDAEGLLPHLHVLEGVLDTRTVGDYDMAGTYHSHTVAIKGELVDYLTLDGKTEYAIVADPDTKPTTSIVRIAGGHTDTLVSGTSTKLWLALAPDGATLAYAEHESFAATSTKPDPLTVYNPNAWTVHLIDLRTGSSSGEIAHAATPRLFSKNGVTYLLYLRPNEVRIRSLADGSEYTLAHPIDGLWPAEVAHDGKYLALFNRDLLSYELFTFDLANKAIQTTQLPQPPSPLRIITFDKTYVAGVAYDMKTKQSSFVVADLAHRSKETVLFTDPKLEHARKVILTP